jgi:Amt family ammonium transporter
MKSVGRKCYFSLVLVLGILTLATVPLSAQQPPAPASTTSSSATPEIPKAVNDKLAQLDQRVTAAQSAGDNAWMLVSAALVLMMTGPGLALFYGGLVRRKNTLAIMMQRCGLWWDTAFASAATVRSSVVSNTPF